jgi:hypothetical protein
VADDSIDACVTSPSNSIALDYLTNDDLSQAPNAKLALDNYDARTMARRLDKLEAAQQELIGSRDQPSSVPASVVEEHRRLSSILS